MESSRRFIFMSSVIGILLLGFYSQTYSEKTAATQQVEKQPIKSEAVRQKMIVSNEPQFNTSDSYNEMIEKDDNALIDLSDLKSIAQCESCLKSLQRQLLSARLSEKKLAELANSLAESNELNIAKMLVETTEKLLRLSKNNKRGALLVNALTKFNSATVANEFLGYLTSGREISTQLQYALTNTINATTDRTQVADDIVKQFNETNNGVVREKLLAVDHPEALAKLTAQALDQNDLPLFNQTKEQLNSNPSDYALDSLLTLKDTLLPDELQQAANTLAERQLSGSRLDYIENKLLQSGYSEQENPIVLEALQHCEDQARCAEILAKFSN